MSTENTINASSSNEADTKQNPKSLSRTQKIVFGSASAFALMLVMAGSAFVYAQSTDTSSTNFLDRVAQIAGIDSTKLKDAFKQASKENIDAKLTEGKITQEQANEMKERIDSEELKGLGFGGPQGRGGIGFMDRGAELDDVAEFLGMSESDLRTALHEDSKTLLTIAKEKGKSETQLTAFLSTKFDERLATAVKDGKITQAQADKMKENKNDRISRLMNETGPRGRR